MWWIIIIAVLRTCLLIGKGKFDNYKIGNGERKGK